MSNAYLRYEYIREAYIDSRTDHLSNRESIERISAEAEAEFNEMIRDQCEAAWDEGLNTGIGYAAVMHLGLPEPTNPYTPND